MSNAGSQAARPSRHTTSAITRRSLALRLALVSAVVVVATSCTSAGQRQSPTDLVWAIGAIEAGPDGAASGIAAMWNDRHPEGPKVRVEALPESADDQRQLMAVELNAGLTGLDILSLDVIWTGEFAKAGWLVDLQSVRSEIEQASLPGPFQSATWGGKLWAAPFTTGAGFLYYRTDLVREPPTTWEELMKVGLDAGRKARIAPFVGQGAQYEGMVVSWLEYLWGAGGDLFDHSGTSVIFEEEPARRALEFMRKARQNGFYPPDFSRMKEEDARTAFQSGDAVFMRNWPYAFRDLNSPDSQVRNRFGIAPLPTFDGRGTVSALGGYNLAVNRASENVEGAKEFVRFASTTREVQRDLALKHSLPPTMTSVYDDLADDPVMALLGKVLPQSRPRPPTPEWSSISDEIQQQVFPAYNGEGDPGPALKAIHRFLQLTLAGD